MDFNFERFTNVNSSYAPKVSIRNTGQIGFSQGLMKRVGVDERDWYVALFYDKRHQAMGLKFTDNAEDIGLVKVQKRETTASDGTVNIGGHISAKSFLDYYGIPFRDQKPQSFVPTFGKDRMVIVLLSDPVGSDTVDEDEEEPPAGESI